MGKGTVARTMFLQAGLGALVAGMAAGPVLARTRSACDLLTLQQVGAALGAAVRIDQSASGPDPSGGDNCVWNSADGRNIMTRILAVKDRNLVQYTFKSALSDAFSNGPPPESLSGVGHEARYRAYTGNLAGGVVVARRGNIVFVVEGLAPKARLVELAKKEAAGL
ncbi:MAG: hypothetical protein IPI06_01510 [Gammaproteobacteria bacterium]|nr:hypothetical protein [Gammaproteobacteria bacterium]